MKRLLLSFAFFMTVNLAFSLENPRVFINSGHPDGIVCLAKSPSKGLLFTGGKDGVIRIWREENLEPIAHIQASPFAVRKMTVSPKSAEFALVESDGFSVSLSVWDWEKNQKKFSVPLPELPSIFQYSPQGNFIIASRTDWKSLLFFDSTNGRPLPYFSSGFGIVSFIFLSSTENTLVSYTSSTGTFIYWNLRQGTRKQTVMSQPELKNLVLFNERYAAGSSGNELVMIDLVTGSVAASSYCEAIRDIICDEKNGMIVTLTGKDSETELQTWKFHIPSSPSETEPLRPGISTKVTNGVQDMIFGQKQVFLAGNDLSAFDLSTWETTVLSEPNIEAASDILSLGDAFYVVTTGGIYRFTSDFFSSRITGPIPKATFLDVSAVMNPFNGPAYLLSPTADQVFLWKHGEDKGEILKINPQTGEPIKSLSAFGYQLLQVRSSPEYLLCLEKNGSIKKISTRDFRTAFEFTSSGFQAVANLGQYGILAGQNSTGTMKIPLVSINPDTGETVTLRHPSVFLFFKIEFDPKNERIYFLGLRKTENGKTETVLQTASASQLESFTVLSSSDFLDIEADLLVDEKSTVFTTMGGGPIRAWNGRNWTSFESNRNRPINLASGSDKLYAVNRDGSVSVWDKTTGKLLIDLCIFKGGDWIAYSPTGNFISSFETKELSRMMVLSSGGKFLPIENYRLYVPRPESTGR